MNELDNVSYTMYMPLYDPYTKSWIVILVPLLHNLIQTYNFGFIYQIR